jgi:iron complex transport system ATP-binding protein
VTAVLELQGVDVERDGAKILSGVDWRISLGENWVLFGPNGAGKTTLLSLLTGYLWPTAGTVDVLGHRLGETDVFELRRLTAVVSDSLRGMINPELTGFQVLVTGARGHLNLFGAPTPVEIRLATHTADLTETGELMTKPFRIMSTGERQRVLIARALMIRPKLLILDEPCAGLDIAAREFVLRTAERAATQRGGPSLILTTHHVEEVTPAFSHCLMLLRGQVFARGKVAEVLRSSILSELFGIEINAAHRHGRWAASVTPAG